ncbi:hypothetical protein LINPERPRIM_LOCUS42991 [Linum perenne]
MRFSAAIFLAVSVILSLINLRFTASTPAAAGQPSCQSMCSECDNPCQPLPLPSPPPPPPSAPSPPPPQSLPPPVPEDCPPPPAVPTYVYPSPPPPFSGGNNCPGACNSPPNLIVPYFPFYYQSPPAATNSAAEMLGFPAAGTILLCILCFL